VKILKYFFISFFIFCKPLLCMNSVFDDMYHIGDTAKFWERKTQDNKYCFRYFHKSGYGKIIDISGPDEYVLCNKYFGYCLNSMCFVANDTGLVLKFLDGTVSIYALGKARVTGNDLRPVFHKKFSKPLRQEDAVRCLWHFVSVSFADGLVQVFDMRQKAQVVIQENCGGRMIKWGFLHDFRYIVLFFEDAGIKVYDALDGYKKVFDKNFGALPRFLKVKEYKDGAKILSIFYLQPVKSRQVGHFLFYELGEHSREMFHTKTNEKICHCRMTLDKRFVGIGFRSGRFRVFDLHSNNKNKCVFTIQRKKILSYFCISATQGAILLRTQDGQVKIFTFDKKKKELFSKYMQEKPIDFSIILACSLVRLHFPDRTIKNFYIKDNGVGYTNLELVSSDESPTRLLLVDLGKNKGLITVRFQNDTGKGYVTKIFDLTAEGKEIFSKTHECLDTVVKMFENSRYAVSLADKKHLEIYDLKDNNKIVYAQSFKDEMQGLLFREGNRECIAYFKTETGQPYAILIDLKSKLENKVLLTVKVKHRVRQSWIEPIDGKKYVLLTFLDRSFRMFEVDEQNKQKEVLKGVFARSIRDVDFIAHFEKRYVAFTFSNYTMRVLDITNIDNIKEIASPYLAYAVQNIRFNRGMLLMRMINGNVVSEKVEDVLEHVVNKVVCLRQKKRLISQSQRTHQDAPERSCGSAVRPASSSGCSGHLLRQTSGRKRKARQAFAQDKDEDRLIQARKKRKID